MASSASAGIEQVLATGSADPSKCHASDGGLEVAVVGEMSTAVLHAIDLEGQPCKEQILLLECELVSEITGIRSRGSTEIRGQNQYQISYQPTVKGRHQLHIRVEGQHIRGSPFGVAVKSPVDKLGTPILTIDNLRRPCDVAINQRGEVVVTEWGANCVSVFSASGERLRSFGTRGSGQGQFESPRGVATDAEGNILVADSKNNSIQKFTVEGRFLAAVGTEGSRHLQFSFVSGIAFNPRNGKIYVTDFNNHRVQILNSDLTHSGTFGRRGTGRGQLEYPSGIACDSTGNIYVADEHNHRIQVFTAEGRFLRMFGGRGESGGQLKFPCGVAVDDHMTYLFNVILCFDRNGDSSGQDSVMP